MNDYLNIGWVGTGNLSWHLAPALDNIGHKVSLVYGRNKKNARSLIDRLYNASFHKNLDFSSTKVNFIIIAVNDSAISEIASEIIAPENCIILHTSGTQPMQVLEKSAVSNFGVLYPLQTFTKNVKVNFKEIPFFIESNSKFTEKILKSLIKNLSSNVYKLNSIQRANLHLAAVFGSNFSNHMLTITKTLMEKYDLNFNLVQVLIYSMFKKAFDIGPEKGQTGPAIRNDHDTMDIHFDMLKDNPEIQELYSLISRSIMNYKKD